jgi:hypothetical protein
MITISTLLALTIVTFYLITRNKKPKAEQAPSELEITVEEKEIPYQQTTSAEPEVDLQNVNNLDSSKPFANLKANLAPGESTPKAVRPKMKAKGAPAKKAKTESSTPVDSNPEKPKRVYRKKLKD